MTAALQQKPQLRVMLMVTKGPHQGQKFDLSKEKILIGRGPENDVVLMNDPQVSRLHAQIVLIERDFEIVRISQKNAVIIDGESVERWKLVNGSVFTVGDSEIQIEYDLGQAVVSVQPPMNAQRLAEVLPLRPPAPPVAPSVTPSSATQVPAQSRPQPPAVKQQPPSVRPQPGQAVGPARQQMHVGQPRMGAPMQGVQPGPWPQQAQAAAPPVQPESDDKKMMFYIVIVVLAVIVGFVMFSPDKPKTVAGKVKSTLKYEDEVAIKLNSKDENELTKSRMEKKVDRNSPQYQRVQENFIRGMRDFQLGNYARARDFFQVVINLDPDHSLAKRHLYLSGVRIDELIQTKLMLGESYYNKHNFKMCAAMYRQVMFMLEDKKADTKYKLAEKKAQECDLAAEGIR